MSFSFPFSCAAPVIVMDCTINSDCAANTDGNTVCVNNLCSRNTVTGKS